MIWTSGNVGHSFFRLNILETRHGSSGRPEDCLLLVCYNLSLLLQVADRRPSEDWRRVQF
ncbi:MAG: hypothetical protein ACJAZW_002656 [Maritalea sp.]|jgi:hypothetical protein